MQREPSRLLAGNFDDRESPHVPGGRSEPVERIDHIGQRTAETEGKRRRRDVVLRRLRNADDRKPLRLSFRATLSAWLTGRSRCRRQSKRGRRSFASRVAIRIIGAIRLLDEADFVDAAHAEGVDARAVPSDSPAPSMLSSMEPHRTCGPPSAIAIGRQQAVEPVVNADQPPSRSHRRERRPGSDGVESRHIPAATIDRDAPFAMSGILVFGHEALDDMREAEFVGRSPLRPGVPIIEVEPADGIDQARDLGIHRKV